MLVVVIDGALSLYSWMSYRKARFISNKLTLCVV